MLKSLVRNCLHQMLLEYLVKIQKAKKENSFIERNSPQFVAVDPTHTTITSERIDPNIYYSRSPLPRKPPLKVVSKTFFTMDNLALITQSTGLLFKGEEISEEDCLVFIFSKKTTKGQ